MTLTVPSASFDTRTKVTGTYLWIALIFGVVTAPFAWVPPSAVDYGLLALAISGTDKLDTLTSASGAAAGVAARTVQPRTAAINQPTPPEINKATTKISMATRLRIGELFKADDCSVEKKIKKQYKENLALLKGVLEADRISKK